MHLAQRRREITAIRLLALLTVGLIAPGTAWAQSGERSMLVSVLDSSGIPVEGLAPSDFVIEEDGTEREVLRVEPATTPMQLAVLVDTSAAAAFATANIREGLEAFVSRLDEDHEIALVTFGNHPRILVESTTQIDRLRDGIGQIFAFPDTAAYLLDALVETTRGFERREAQRPVIVAVTSDGIDYSSQSARRALEGLRANQVATHVIVLQNQANAALRASAIGGGGEVADQLYQRDLMLEQGPTETGGQRHDLLVSSALVDTLDRLASILTSQYDVVYSRPTSLIPPDEIVVRMRRDDLSAHGTPVRQSGE
ncbi:MAG: VWA domain-containing protein [Vicinamibacterales bacterium]|jgi:VWFA-related protein|nr:VWA domain-containing protein [Vicinamibacterales bacterium]